MAGTHHIFYIAPLLWKQAGPFDKEHPGSSNHDQNCQFNRDNIFLGLPDESCPQHIDQGKENNHRA